MPAIVRAVFTSTRPRPDVTWTPFDLVCGLSELACNRCDCAGTVCEIRWTPSNILRTPFDLTRTPSPILGTWHHADGTPFQLAGTSSGLSAQLTALKAAIDDADTEATTQVSGTLNQAIDQRDVLRAALRSQHLEPILHVTRELEKTSPGLPKLVNMCDARSTQGLLTAVQAVPRDLPPYKDQRAPGGFPGPTPDRPHGLRDRERHYSPDQDHPRPSTRVAATSPARSLPA